MKIQMNVTLRQVCVTIGVLHLIIIGLRIYERIWEIITLEEPFLIEEHTGILTSYGIQIFIACLLIYGSVAESLNFTLPWLLVTAPHFFWEVYMRQLLFIRKSPCKYFVISWQCV
ncbi:unnamed protein product [Diabrotica balteata]|uniref:Uncharacterized protein n=1 Tax=Diabrotica balteata TaxID=107213 RepID=A0A9N9SXA1_DIABA|nr:unnamed protein product [Diabrotica balteata]